MTQVTKVWPLLTATHRYEKSLSTHGRGQGEMIDAPILAYLIETTQGRILYDVGCDYQKIHQPHLRSHYYEDFHFGAPHMDETQRLTSHLGRLGLTAADVDVIFIGHLHFDHAGGLKELYACGCGAEVHVQQAEVNAALLGNDSTYFNDDFEGLVNQPFFKRMQGEYTVCDGVHAISSVGHTAGHMSLLIELPHDAPIILAGDAADLEENLLDEVAPGYCWQHNFAQGQAAIRKLKTLAKQEKACIWPNHDMNFYRTLPNFVA